MPGFRRTLWTLLLGATTVGRGVNASVAIAQLAVSANDNKVVLVNSVSTVVQNPAPDPVAVSSPHSLYCTGWA